MSNFETSYPQKPVLQRKKKSGHIYITLFSMVLFALTFSLILNDYYLITIILGVLLLHEGGHFLMMKLFKYKELNMLFIPFLGAMVSGRKKEYSQIESSIMVLAGPIPGIVLGSFLLVSSWIEPSSFIIQLSVILILLNVVNLIPVEPLDGGQLVRILFFANFEYAQLIFIVTSSLAFMVLGVIVNSWLLIIFGLLLGLRIRNRHKLYLIRKDMRDEDIVYELNYEDVSDENFIKIKDILHEHTPVLDEMKEYSEEEEYNQMMARQVNGVLAPPTKRDASALFKILMLAIWLGGIVLSVYALVSTELNTIVNAFQYR